MTIEIKINKEIRDYTESVFFGLSARQCVFSVLALAVAVGLYFFLRPYAGIETVSWRLLCNESVAFEPPSVSEPAGSEWSRTATSWMCMLGAAPFAACGFFRYHGMNAEQCLIAWLKCQLLLTRQLIFLPKNSYHIALKTLIAKYEYPTKSTRKVRATHENTHNTTAAG